MMRLLLGLLFLVSITEVSGQLSAVSNRAGYDYWLYLPQSLKDDSMEKVPVLVFLHGRSLSGSDINRVKRYGVLRAMERGRRLDAIVIAPQTSNGWSADDVINIVDEVLTKYAGDEKRVYVCGMSMGAYGTMEVAGKYPDRIAAAVAICGGGTPSLACNLSQVPIWLQHGNKDTVVPLRESKSIYEAIKRCDQKADVTLTVIPGGTHSNVESLFHRDDIYDWMFQHQSN